MLLPNAAWPVASRALAALFLLASLAAPPARAIVVRHDVDAGAYLADASEFPAVFGIYQSEAGAPDCLAILVASQWALTAAHCTQDPPLVKALEQGESHAVKLGYGDNAIDRVVRHPSWTGEVTDESFDLALVRLAEPVSGIDPVPLYVERDEVSARVTLVGWGDTGTGMTGPEQADGRFRLAENRVDGVDQYWLWWDFSDSGTATFVPCLEGISGPGDSGGPAFIRDGNGWRLAGISSSQVTGGGPEGLYGVTEYYARVSTAQDWIRSVVAGKLPAVGRTDAGIDSAR